MNKHKKAKVACQAIDHFGGIKPLSQELKVPYDRVRKWKDNGVAPYFIIKVHELTGVPLYKLDPQLYPKYLFDKQ